MACAHHTAPLLIYVFEELVNGVVRSVLPANRLTRSITVFDYAINAALILNVLGTKRHRVTLSKILINIIFIPTVFVDKNKILIIIASQVLVLEGRFITSAHYVSLLSKSLSVPWLVFKSQPNTRRAGSINSDTVLSFLAELLCSGYYIGLCSFSVEFTTGTTPT